MVESVNFAQKGLFQSQILDVPAFLRVPKWESVRNENRRICLPSTSLRVSIDTAVLAANLEEWHRSCYLPQDKLVDAIGNVVIKPEDLGIQGKDVTMQDVSLGSRDKAYGFVGRIKEGERTITTNPGIIKTR